MLRRLAAGLCLLAAPAAAAAQDRVYSVEEIAADGAYGFCPLYLAGQFPLSAPQLAERGFGTEVTARRDPRFGEVSYVTAKRDDGEIVFGGAPGKICSVAVSGPRRPESLAKLRDAMSWTGLDFAPTANLAPDIEGIEVETFKAAVEGQTLYVQLIEGGGPAPVVMAQLFAMEP